MMLWRCNVMQGERKGGREGEFLKLSAVRVECCENS